MHAPRRPRLMPGVRVVEQLYQGEQGFVAKSSSTGAYFRFRSSEGKVLARFDGEHTIEQIVAALASDGLKLTTAAVEAFATRLGVLGLVERTLAERSSAQMERLRVERKERRRRPLFQGELLRMRWRVGDPNAVLTRTLPWLRWCFTPAFVYGSLVLFAVYALILISHWSEIASGFAALTLPANLTFGTGVMIWTTFLFIGFVHEMGHAYTCKFFSGDVDDMGVMVIYFQPAFYCNVNDAWSFSDVRHRLWVTAAGGWIELILAALAALTWLVARPGTLIAEFALIVTFLAGGLTLLSNANPLLAYDGYFALSDWLEIPNLRQRASAYLRWWLATRVLQREYDEPEVTERERRIFLVYGTCSALYVTLVLYVLSTLLFGWATRVFGVIAVGLLMLLFLLIRRDRVRAFYFAVQHAARDLYRASLRGPVGRFLPERLRGWGGIMLALLIVMALPWSRTVDGSWVALPVRSAAVTSPTDGVVDRVFVSEGQSIKAGAPLLHVSNLALDSSSPERLRVRDSLRAQLRVEQSRGSTAAARTDASAAASTARARELESERTAGAVSALSDGQLLSRRPEDLIGRYVVAGTPLMLLGAVDSLDVRIILEGGGSASVATGQPASLLLDADAARPLRVTVESVGAITGARGEIEARVRIPASATWRPGMRGAARVRIARGTVFGAIVWAVRTRVRSNWLL